MHAFCCVGDSQIPIEVGQQLPDRPLYFSREAPAVWCSEAPCPCINARDISVAEVQSRNFHLRHDLLDMRAVCLSVKSRHYLHQVGKSSREFHGPIACRDVVYGEFPD